MAIFLNGQNITGPETLFLRQDFKASVRAATTGNITLSGLQTIDTVSLVAGDRVLVKNQTTGSENGVYVAASGAWARAVDFDGNEEVTSGATVFVEEGDVNDGSGFSLITPDPIIVGTTDMAFVKSFGSSLVPHGPTHVETGSDPVPNATITVGGLMSGADKTKLDGVETGATADQTGAEIKVAYEGEANTNAFTDAEQTKLTGIEAGATADQTGAEIKVAYEAEADTNAFTDAEQTKLSGIEASAKDDQSAVEVPFTPVGGIAAINVQAALAEVDSEAEKSVNKGAANGYAPLDASSDLPLVNLPIHAGGHVDGTDDIQDATAGQKGLATAVQIAKLDGIEVGAKDDQVASEVPFTPAGTIAATDVQAAIAEAASEAEQAVNKGAAGGYAPLDGSTLLPLANLPAHQSTHVSGGSDPFVQADVLEAASRAVRISLRNESGSALSKGDLVSVSGFSVPEGRPIVDLADKDLASFRPAIAVVEASVANNTNFEGLVVGLLTGLDTSSFVVNAQLVLGDDGAVSAPPPDVDPFTGEVQLIGSVVRSDVSAGSIYFSLSSSLLPMTAAQFFWTKEVATTGLVTGGDVTRVSGLDVTVALGEGFVNTGGTLFRVNWDVVANLSLTVSASNHIFVDSSGVVQASVSLPSSESNILLAIAITDGTTVIFLSNHKVLLEESSSRTHQYVQDVVGPITVSGITTAKSGTALQLNVDAGTFYIRAFRVSVPLTNDLTFTYWHRDGSGGFTKLTGQTTIDPENFDDGSGTLVAITAGKYKKDLLFVAPTSVGAVEYHVFYGQEEFDTQSAAEGGSLPAADSDVLDNSIRSGGIVVLKSAAVIASVTDERPFLGQLSPGTTAVTDHSQLGGLGGTDHPAYQEGAEKGAVNGYAPLDGSADLPLANLPAHASIHERAGSDEIDGDHLGIDFTPVNYTPDITPPEAANADDLAAHLKGIDDALSGGGTGDVVGPASAVDSNLASFDSTTGKLIKDSGIAQANVEQTPNKNAANGYAGLGAGSRIAKAQGHLATVYNDQANTYSAGAKQTVQPSATTAGLNIASGADPSALSQGDVFLNINDLKWRGSAATQTAERQANKGAANGYAPLDAGSDLPLANLPNHAANHVDGTDDIQDATAAQKGLATAAQITKLDAIETGATADQIASEVVFTPTGTIAATDVQAAIAEAALEAEQIANKNAASGYPGLVASKINGAQQTYGIATNTAAQGNDVRFGIHWAEKTPKEAVNQVFAGSPDIVDPDWTTTDAKLMGYKEVIGTIANDKGGVVYEFLIPEGVTALNEVRVEGKLGVASNIAINVRVKNEDGTEIGTGSITSASQTALTISSFSPSPSLTAGERILVEVEVNVDNTENGFIGNCRIKMTR